MIQASQGFGIAADAIIASPRQFIRAWMQPSWQATAVGSVHTRGLDLVAMCGETTGSWHFAWNRWSRGSAPQAAASMPSPRSHWAWGARRSTPAFCEPSHRRCWLQFGTGALPLRSWLAHRPHGGSVALRYTKPVRCCGWVGGAAWMGSAECACAATD